MNKSLIVEMVKSKKNGGWTFTLEAGKGETYRDNKPTLYGHSEYAEGSVLEGKPLRRFVEKWNEIGEARSAIEQMKAAVPGFEVDDQYDGGNSSHIPIDQMVAHLPDDTDY